jgi:hypothetical protein
MDKGAPGEAKLDELRAPEISADDERGLDDLLVDIDEVTDDRLEELAAARDAARDGVALQRGGSGLAAPRVVRRLMPSVSERGEQHFALLEELLMTMLEAVSKRPYRDPLDSAGRPHLSL